MQPISESMHLDKIEIELSQLRLNLQKFIRAIDPSSPALRDFQA
jgi:hypothetical protein